MADQQAQAANDTSPFDVLWSWLATATLSVAVVSFLLMSAGLTTFFGTQNPIEQADAKVNIAYFAALACGGGLLALGLIAHRYLKAGPFGQGIPWPRYALLEGEVRHSFTAWIALAAVLLIPLITIYAAIYRYVRDSKIACWDASNPLSQGFLDSRIAALSETCQGSAMLRMAPKDDQAPYAVQWFFWTDVLLAMVIVMAVIVWVRYLLRVRTMRR